MKRMENRSSSQRGKVICQLKLHLLTDKAIKDRQSLIFMSLEERKTESGNICLVKHALFISTFNLI